VLEEMVHRKSSHGGSLSIMDVRDHRLIASPAWRYTRKARRGATLHGRGLLSCAKFSKTGIPHMDKLFWPKMPVALLAEPGPAI
jgi:hypothetical protein